MPPFCLAGLFILLVGLAGCAPTKTLTPRPDEQILTGHRLGQSDAHFVTLAYQTVQLDRAEGQPALEHAGSPEVRAIAAMLISRADALYPYLEAAIAQDGMQPPGRLPAPLQREVDALTPLQGAAFDRAYLADQIASHRRAVAVFATELQNTQEPAMRALAQPGLAAVNDSLRQLEALQAAMP